jgi:hypothetical protein
MVILNPMGGDPLLRIIGLCETFFLDVAVLVFVFPVLDTLVSSGAQRLTLKLILWTLTVSGVFFLAAVMVSILFTRRERSHS